MKVELHSFVNSKIDGVKWSNLLSGCFILIMEWIPTSHCIVCRHFEQENVCCTWWESNPEWSNLSPGHIIDWAVPLWRRKEKYEHQSEKFVSLGFVIEFNLVHFRKKWPIPTARIPSRSPTSSALQLFWWTWEPACGRITIYWRDTNYSQHLTRKRYWFPFTLLTPLW